MVWMFKCEECGREIEGKESAKWVVCSNCFGRMEKKDIKGCGVVESKINERRFSKE